MGFLRRLYPFNAEQTVNILSEFGPLVTMFVVNGATGDINTGTWALIISTVVAMVVMRVVLGRFPVFPIIASSVTIFFGALTLVTGDPMWVQIKVTIFNTLFAGFLFGGLWATSPLMGGAARMAVLAILGVGVLGQIPFLMGGMPDLKSMDEPVTTNLICLGSVLIGFLLGGLVFKRNFFGYVFEKTFHFTQEGWDRFTFSFAWFFVFTAVMNEIIRQIFDADVEYMMPLIGAKKGIDIWILFKIAFVMPISGIYAWFLTRLMHKYKIEEPVHDAPTSVAHGGGSAGQGYVLAQTRGPSAPTK